MEAKERKLEWDY